MYSLIFQYSQADPIAGHQMAGTGIHDSVIGINWSLHGPSMVPLWCLCMGVMLAAPAAQA